MRLDCRGKKQSNLISSLLFPTSKWEQYFLITLQWCQESEYHRTCKGHCREGKNVSETKDWPWLFVQHILYLVTNYYLFIGVIFHLAACLLEWTMEQSLLWRKGKWVMGYKVAPQLGTSCIRNNLLFSRFCSLLTSHVKKICSFPSLTLNFFSPFTDSEIRRRSHLELLDSKASLCVPSFFAIGWVLLPLSSYLVLK